jgi:hypothetical protein
MTEYMDESDYKCFIRIHDEFKSVLVGCAQEISMISNGRELIGTWNEDVDLWNEGVYLVQFESYSCGDSDYDSVNVPVEYIYDEEYREYYKSQLILKKERRAKAAVERKAGKNVTRYRVITDERAEYERLKVKFGD